MSDDRESLKDVSWRQLFPWLILHRAWKTSLAPPLLMLATVGCLLTPVGWNVATWMFSAKADSVVSSPADDSTREQGEEQDEEQEQDDEQEQGDEQEQDEEQEQEQDEEQEQDDEQEQDETDDKQEPAAKQPAEVEEPPSKGDEEPVELDSGVTVTPATEYKEDYSDYTRFPGSIRDDIEFSSRSLSGRTAFLLIRTGSAIEGVFWRGVGPFQRIFQLSNTWSEYFLLATGTIWTLLVWGIIGGAITRVAVVRLGCDEAVPIRSALGYSSSRLSAYMLSPLFPILFVLLLAIPLALLGILMRFEMGVLLVSLVWILVLVAGLGMAYQLLGTMFGWPLMWVVISAEETGDHYEAYSRSFAYTFQRPFHYLFYATVALVLGGLGWVLIQVFAELTIYMSYWSVMWGCGLENVKELREVGGTVGGEEGRMLTTGRLLMKASEGLVGLVASAYAYSFFWCASAGIYLLLRKSVDQTEFDEVFIDDAQSSFDLPPLRDDDSVVPVIADENASNDSAAAGSGDTEEVNTAAQADAEEKPAATDEDLEADDPEEEVIF